MQDGVHISLIISRGLKKTPYQHPKATIGDPTIVIIPEYKVADQSVSEVGIKLATVETIRDYRVQNPNINSLSKHNCIAACIEAEKKGADEGLMFDPNGYVSTCNSTNFFIKISKQQYSFRSTLTKYPSFCCFNNITIKTIFTSNK